MTSRFRVANNKAAVWTGSGDTKPFDNPTSNLSRVKFHSDLDYIKVIDEGTFNVALSARSNFQDVSHSYALYNHGKSGFPFILGKLTMSGQPVAFCGSIPIQSNRYNGSADGGFARWISLGANNTTVYLYEYAVNLYTKDVEGNVFADSYPAITVPVTVWMTDEILQ